MKFVAAANSSFSIKIFSLNAVGSSMGKYFIFIVVFLFSFMINISVSSGETKKDIETDEMDVYYKKTKIFRDWDKNKSAISEDENKLISLYPEQFNKKKEIVSQPEVEVAKVKIIYNAIKGNISLEAPQETPQTPVADSILSPHLKSIEIEEKPQMAMQENKALIYGNNFEQNCYLSKNDCSFLMSKEVEQYYNKLNPQKERVDTKRYPIDF